MRALLAAGLSDRFCLSSNKNAVLSDARAARLRGKDMKSKILPISAVRRNRQSASRDYHSDMMRAAILQIRVLRSEIAALKKMIPPPPFCDGMEN